jgi:hypothetical protein
MKPTGKGYGGFDIYPPSEKQYKCNRCGHVTKQVTNTYEPTWSWGHFNTCPNCPPWAKYPEFGGSTVWICLDKPGEEQEVQQQADSVLPPPPKAAEMQTSWT